MQSMSNQDMMMTPRIIAICGLKRSGKDALADALCNLYGYEKIKISEGLKEVLKTLFSFTEAQLESDLKDLPDAKWGVTPRKIMQFMGTEIMQYEIQKVLPNVGRTFWIKKIIDTYIDSYPSKRYVISDMRFLHEYEALQKYFPYVIRVERDGGNLDPGCTHPSETEFKSIPYNALFDNRGTLLDIDQYAKSLFKS